MTLIRVLRPDVPEPPRAAMNLAPRRELPDTATIGLIANGKPLARELLAVLADEIARRLERNLERVWLEKPSASSQISAEEAGSMAVRAHIVITGLGD